MVIIIISLLNIYFFKFIMLRENRKMLMYEEHAFDVIVRAHCD